MERHCEKVTLIGVTIYLGCTIEYFGKEEDSHCGIL